MSFPGLPISIFNVDAHFFFKSSFKMWIPFVTVSIHEKKGDPLCKCASSYGCFKCSIRKGGGTSIMGIPAFIFLFIFKCSSFQAYEILNLRVIKFLSFRVFEISFEAKIERQSGLMNLGGWGCGPVGYREANRMYIMHLTPLKLKEQNVAEHLTPSSINVSCF